MLRHRNDALVNPTVRPGSSRYHFPCLAPTVRRHDRSRNPHKQNGARATTGLRSDARSTMGHLHGQLRERRRILPLQLLGHKRLRQDRTGGYLCAWMPANSRGAHVWHLPAAEENETHKDHKNVVQEVDGGCLLASLGSGHYVCELRGIILLYKSTFLCRVPRECFYQVLHLSLDCNVYRP